MGEVAGAAREESAIPRRLGLIVPSSNTVAEPDFARSVPDGVTVHTARAYLEEVTASAERAMLESFVPRAAADLATANMHAIVFSCTSAAALLGKSGEERFVEELEESGGAPVISTNEAISRVLVRYGDARVAVVTPYIEELNVAIAGTLRERGVSVRSIVGMSLDDNVSIGRVRPDEIVAFVEQHADPSEFDVLFVSCTNLRGMESRETLEDRLGRPVVTSNSAALTIALEVLDGSADVHPSAELLRNATSR